MLTQQALYSLLDLDILPDSPRVLIYSEEKTERLDYTCHFIFTIVLKLKYTITSNPNEFKTHKGTYINYSKSQITGAFNLIPKGLLEEKEISKEEPSSFTLNGNLFFYPTPENINFPYDIFSAVFYFISRMEEWQDFEQDRHQRFEVTSSLLYKNKVHLKPVVDRWIIELADALEKYDPTFKLPAKKFRVLSTIDIDNLYAYKAKGFFRTAGACAKDILKVDLKNLKERFLVISGKKKDPFDIYESISDFCFEKKIPLIYFFLFRTGTEHDRTVDPESSSFKNVFKTLKENHALIGLHPSYYSSTQPDLFKKEKDLLTLKSGEEVSLSRQHYLRFNIRSTPQLLIEQGFVADFTMGFASGPGFRAGTSHPFNYYDFSKEKSTSLLFVPFCVMDGAYTVYENKLPDQAYEEIMNLAQEIKKVNGIFISVFHERSFSDHLYKGFGSLYKNLHSALKEL